ncbi:MAG: UDP-3-O-(3-hydroxymyristoyl)glucosamine N-acyltransferase [Candidatus Omnitrophota bacterium]|nr:MAG: UDP-3-O-(3-hydroxymyristoyl)glucosamine N-acyltransferase [Candidatus Omnitrophota bacterium]
MKKSLLELAKLIGGKIEGEDVLIYGVAGIEDAQEGEISFVEEKRYLPLLEKTMASAVVVAMRDREEVEKRKRKGLSLLYTENPSFAFSKIVPLFAPPVRKPKGIHPSAIIAEDVILEEDVAIQAYVVIENKVRIGRGTVIYSGVYIGEGTSIGEECIIYANVSIRERTQIGNRVIIHNGTVIGSDGFGYSTVGGVHHKIPQIGWVEIGDDVEIGANVTIDRARFSKTCIGKGTKIDNLVQIGHNVNIEENAIIVSQVGISGSVKIGKNVILAGQVGVAGHLSIGDNVVVAAKSGVTKSIPANTSVSGFPAKPHQEEKRVKACIQRLPALFRRVKKLEERVGE